MSSTLVTIYAPSGNPEKHTTLNAVDLVRDCGYTFKPGKQYAPTDGMPYADPQTGKLPSRAQQALDSVGTGSEVGSEAQSHMDALAIAAGASAASEPAPSIRPAPAPAPEVEAPAPVVEPEVVAEPVVEPEVVAEAAPAATAPKPRHQRAKKA